MYYSSFSGKCIPHAFAAMSTNKDEWKNFVWSRDDTNTIKPGELPTNKLNITTTRNTKCLATEFANCLLKKKGGIVVLRGTQDVLNSYKHLEVSKNQPETPITKGNIPLAEDEKKEKPHIDETLELIEIRILADNIEHVSDDVDIERLPETPTPSNEKENDMGKSCSKWNISNIAEYFSFKDCVIELKMPTRCSANLDKIYEMVQKDIRLRLQVVRGIDLKEKKRDYCSKFLRQLISITSIETGSRLVLDALLVPLCSVLNLQFEVEKKIECNFLPDCRLDYCIRKGEHIIGCIEAKTVTSWSNDSSIAQGVLQLIILQAILLRTETPKVNISEFPVFAIVTDGHRFIYIQLKGSSLGFEYEKGELKFREVRQESDFKDILRHISFLVDQGEDDVILID